MSDQCLTSLDHRQTGMTNSQCIPFSVATIDNNHMDEDFKFELETETSRIRVLVKLSDMNAARMLSN